MVASALPTTLPGRPEVAIAAIAGKGAHLGIAGGGLMEPGASFRVLYQSSPGGYFRSLEGERTSLFMLCRPWAWGLAFVDDQGNELLLNDPLGIDQ